MRTVNILDAKTNFSQLVQAVESGAESEIIIARNGKPVVRIAPLTRKPPVIGSWKGKFEAPKDFDALNPQIERLFYGEDIEESEKVAKIEAAE